MVSREEYKKYIREIVEKGNKDINLKKEISKYGNSNGIMSIIGILIAFGGFLLTFLYLLVGIVIIIFGCILVAISVFKTSQKDRIKRYLDNNYKKDIIKFLLKNNEYTYDEFGKIQSNIFLNSQFANDFDIYKCEDYLSINIPNDDNTKSSLYLNMCDVSAIKVEYDDEGNRQEKKIYTGAFGYIHFPFTFKCALCINSTYKKEGLKWGVVNLEDINFNKKYKIYSNDQIEARYILTPQLMEDMLLLSEKIKHLKITIIENKMYIGFENKNLFEFERVKNNDVLTFFDDIFDEIEAILKIVNEIKTNNKVFKM